MADKRATATPEKLDSILTAIQAMTLGIETEPDGPEKDLMRAHMERLINQYRITEDELNALNREAGRAPIAVPGVRTFRAFRYGAGSEYNGVYRQILAYCITHAQCRGVITYEQDGDGSMWAVAHVVGYEQDARYAEALYTEARAYFANRMEPTVDSRLSDAENVYRLRSAGVERGRIGQMMGWGDKAHMKVTKVYKEECARRGEDAVMTGKGNTMRTFREAFAQAYPATLWDRLWNVRMAARESGAIELKGRKEAVDEEFYTLFPAQRPKPVKATQEPVKAKSSRRSGWTKADEARWQRLNGSVAGRMGQRAGERAAREVNVKGSGTTEKLGE